jgi:hypothetical protein
LLPFGHLEFVVPDAAKGIAAAVVSVTAGEGAIFSANWEPHRNRCVSAGGIR